MAPVAPLEHVTIVFDLDGTLVDTAPDLLAALNHTLVEFEHLEVPSEATYALIGHGAKAMLHAGLEYQGAKVDESRLDDMFEVFLSFYEDNIAVESLPFPGCVLALERMAVAGATLAVCTNKRQNLAKILLNALGLTHHFVSIVGADSVANKKPAAEHILTTLERAKRAPKPAIMVGDSETDEKAAQNAGLPFIFVPMGYGPISDETRNHGCVLNHYDDLTVSLIERLLAD